MVIFIDTKGNAEIITPENVYQGSDSASEIIVIAPFAASTVMQIGFILPNGLYWNASPLPAGGRYAPMEFVEQSATTRANVWKYTLPHSVTEQPGKVQIAINAVTRITVSENITVEQSNVTSYLCEFTVQESVLPTLPSAPTADVYTLLSQYLSRLDQRTVVMPNLVTGVEKVAPNAFRTVSLDGSHGAKIVLENNLGTPLDPMGAASTVYISNTIETESKSGAWVPIYDGNTIKGYRMIIPAAMHAQMRDGATARDLWVSFSAVDESNLDGIYQSFSVNNDGDITITASKAMEMNVRVWNGIGIGNNVNISDIEPYGTDENGGNVYKIILTNGEDYDFIAPQGPQGPKGDKGEQGEPGSGGIGINETVIDYAFGTSGTTPPTEGWQTAIPSVPQGGYLWTRVKFKYSNSEVKTSYSVARQDKTYYMGSGLQETNSIISLKYATETEAGGIKIYTETNADGKTELHIDTE